jgi:Raf kinase inhibitor-like YbhB/YbcL family protein
MNGKQPPAFIRISFAAIGAAALLLSCSPRQPSPGVPFQGSASTLRVTSPAFAENGYIPPRYTCQDLDVSPPLQISGVPSAAKSLALIVHDPDAPGGDWVHWIAWNIPTTTKDIREGSLPPGAVEGINSFGKKGWGGPCPPSGAHHYHFELYALDVMPGLPPSSRRDELVRATQEHTLARADLVGLYSKR